MILLCGIPSERPLALVAEQLARSGVPYLVFNQRQFAATALWFEVVGGRVTGELDVAGRRCRLEEISGVYTRLMDDRMLPEFADQPADSALRRHCRRVHEALLRWYEIAPARVVNRTNPMGSNSSKPYQAQLIRTHGFAIPETLVTNDPDRARAFVAEHGRVIYKSISGVRSIVQLLEEADLPRLERIRWCPTQFQAFVDGTNVRVHVVGDAVFATAIASEAADYRYAERQYGQEATLSPLVLTDDLAARCVRLAAALDLPFAGIDLKITPDQRVVCFEVNPSPAFSYYEAHTGQPIAAAVARYLAALDR